MSLLNRAVTKLLLSAPVRRWARGTPAGEALASLAEQNGRTELVAELSPSVAEPMPPPDPAVAMLFEQAKRQVDQGHSLSAAVRTIEKALKKAPDDVACLALAVMAFSLSGKQSRAEFFVRRAIALAPRIAGLHASLGNCLLEQRKYEEALASYRMAFDISPTIIQVRYNLAQCLTLMNRPKEAWEFYLLTVSQPPATLAEKICQASSLLVLNRLQEAEELLDQILAEAPAQEQALVDLIVLYRRTRRHTLAEELLLRVGKKRPSDAWVYRELSIVYLETRRPAEALEAARRAHALKPTAFMALAGALSALGKLTEAEHYAREALSHQHGRRHGEIAMLMVILEQLGRFDEALSLAERLVAEDPEKGWPHYALSLALLRFGDFDRGWREHEWRWKWEQNQNIPRDQGKPQWSAQARKGSSVLIWAEQGFGDSIQCLRYIPELIEAGFKPIVEIQTQLTTLARATLSCPVVSQGDPLPAFDTQIPFMSIPYALSATPETIPSRRSYLKTDPAKTAVWRERLAPDGRLLVGLQWAGSPMHGNDRFRSIPFEKARPLLDIDAVRFVSLQKAVRKDEALLAERTGRLETQWIDDCADFADSAALVANLDLVIGVDSAVIHLAGALGIPGWVLLAFCSDWRWLLGREDSIWYESLRLFRQPAHDDWASALRQVEDALREKTAGRDIRIPGECDPRSAAPRHDGPPE